MEQGTIKLKEALEIMERRDKNGEPVPFAISFWTFSSISKKGGKLKVYDKVTYLPSAKPGRMKPDTLHNILDPLKASRNPNHFKNRTRNIQLPDGNMKKLHIDFIRSINNQKVIY